jgi:ribosome recycling factor
MSSQRAEEPTVESVLADADSRMSMAVEFLGREVGSLRTGRATAALVEGVMVDYYGTPTPLNQLASITVPEARLIVIQPYDRQAMQNIEKGLQRSDTGLNPSSDGTVIRVAVPPLTQERRRDIVRTLKRKVEDSKVAVRNVRRDAVERLRTMERDKSLPQDDNRRAQDRLQKATDTRIGELDKVSSAKEAEIMQV